MLRILLNSKPLDLNPDASLEMLLNSPLFLSDSLYSDFSYGLQIPCTDNNLRQLGDVFSQDVKLSTFFDVDVYDGNTFLFACKLIIDRPTVSIRTKELGAADGYLVGGIGRFFYDIKYQRLGQLRLGGPRSFEFTTWDPYDGSGGLWQHLHATWDGSYDYVCLPYINEAMTLTDASEASRILEGWVNRLDFGTLYDGWEGSDGSTITTGGNDVRMARNYQPVLSLKVKYLFEQICNENGWRLDSSLLDGTNFDKLIMIGSVPIRIATDLPWNNPVSTTFSLSNLVSPEITCVDFIMQRCRRYGWWPFVDADARILKLVPLKNTGSAGVKDYTAYAQPMQQINASNGARSFAFKNNFPTSDGYPSAPNLSEYIVGSPVKNAESLPEPSGYYDRFVILCVEENAYYHIVFSEDLPLTDPVTSSRKWEKLADNIYDIEPKDATDTFESKVTPMPLHYSVFRSNSDNEIFYAAFLRCNMDLLAEWGMRDVFYFGMVDEQKIGLPLPDGFYYKGQMREYLAINGSVDKMLTPGPYQVPFASPLPVLPDGTVVGEWADVFYIPRQYLNADRTTQPTAYKGIVDYWFKTWLNMNSNAITNQVNLNLPLHELLSLQWDVIVNICNVPYLLMSLVVPVPYKGTAKATLQPVILDPSVLSDTRYPYAGPVFLKMVWENIVDAPDETFMHASGGWSSTISSVKKAVAKIYAYGDEQGTIPIKPANIPVIAFRKVTYPVGEAAEDIEPAFMININDEVTQLSATDPELYQYNLVVSLNPAALYHASVVYVLQASDAYQLIS